MRPAAEKKQKNAVLAKNTNKECYRTIFFRLKRNFNLNNEWARGWILA